MRFLEVSNEISQALENLDEEKLVKSCKEALEKKLPATEIVDEMAKGMEEVGRKYESNEYFLPELILAGNIMKSGLEIVKQYLVVSGFKAGGKILMGTVKGDLHDIGKNIVISMLTSAGFDIVDLGVDVPVETFVEKVREEKPDILGMSALLSTTINLMEEVIEALKEAGLREKVKVIVGGRPVSPRFAKKIGADAYGETAVDAVRIIRDLMRGTCSATLKTSPLR